MRRAAPGSTTEEAERMKALEQENRELRRANEILRRAAVSSGRSSTANRTDRGVHRRTRTMWRSPLGVEPICAVLQVAPSTYYAAKSRPLSERARRDAELIPRWWRSGRTNYRVYGARKLWKAARRAGIDIGRDQIARLMRQAGIQGVRRAKRVRTTRRDAARRPASGSRRAPLHRQRPERVVGHRPDLTCRRGPGSPTCASSSTRSPG